MAVLAITPAQVKLGAGKHDVDKDGRAGVALVAGKVVYFDDAAKRYKLADSAALATAVVKGIVINGADVDQPVAVCRKGKVILGAAAAPRVGGTYVLNAAGNMVEENDALHAVGKFTSVIGPGLGNDDIDVNPTVSNVQKAA